METVLYFLARGLIWILQKMPLRWVASLGRAGGLVGYWLDKRHRRIAIQNLTHCFGDEKSVNEIQALAKENFRRLGENYACAIRTAFMTNEELRPHIEFGGDGRIPSSNNLVVAIGHFGNFELYARMGMFVPGFQFATTYRALRQPALTRLVQDMRERSGCIFFERRSQGNELKAAMNKGGIMLGLLADQHAGAGGVRVPFFGRECATSSAPAVFALRYDARLITGFCFRVGLGRWRMEPGDEIPIRDEAGKARPVEDITLDMNKAFEQAILRDPANWFWVHNRWKSSLAPQPKPVSNPVPCP